MHIFASVFYSLRYRDRVFTLALTETISPVIRVENHKTKVRRGRKREFSCGKTKLSLAISDRSAVSTLDINYPVATRTPVSLNREQIKESRDRRSDGYLSLSLSLPL